MARKLLDDQTPTEIRETELDLKIKPDEDAVYCIRSLSVEKAREIKKRFTRMAFDPTSHRKVEQVDEVGLNDALLDYAIASWTGVSNGTALAPCDLEHKLKLPVDVQRAILERAQVNEDSAEVRAASFRQPGDVRSVLGG